MNEEKICSMVKDLLPLYVDGLTSKETNGVLESHMASCPSCQSEYRILKADVEAESPMATTPVREVDYLKKIRKYQNINLIMGALISFFLGASLPPAILVLSFIDRGIPNYFLARLRIAWHIGLLKMFIWGVTACILYLVCMLLVRKIIRRKRRIS